VAREARAGHPERLEDGLGHVGLERHSRPGGQHLAQDPEAGVGVDPLAARQRDPGAVEAKARGVGQEVGDGRTLGAGGVVEPDGLLLHGHQHGHGRQQLADRSQREWLVERTGAGQRAFA
jgi:hypothetical protein